jgi:hypothetical protein
VTSVGVSSTGSTVPGRAPLDAMGPDALGVAASAVVLADSGAAAEPVAGAEGWTDGPVRAAVPDAASGAVVEAAVSSFPVPVLGPGSGAAGTPEDAPPGATDAAGAVVTGVGAAGAGAAGAGAAGVAGVDRAGSLTAGSRVTDGTRSVSTGPGAAGVVGPTGSATAGRVGAGADAAGSVCVAGSGSG